MSVIFSWGNPSETRANQSALNKTGFSLWKSQKAFSRFDLKPITWKLVGVRRKMRQHEATCGVRWYNLGSPARCDCSGVKTTRQAITVLICTLCDVSKSVCVWQTSALMHPKETVCQGNLYQQLRPSQLNSFGIIRRKRFLY